MNPEPEGDLWTFLGCLVVKVNRGKLSKLLMANARSDVTQRDLICFRAYRN